MTTIINHRVVNDPLPEPVSLTEAKAWIRYSATDEDDLIVSLVKTARLLLEKYTGLAFVKKDMEVLIDVQDRFVDLPYGPLGTITKVVDHTNFGGSMELTEGTHYEIIGQTIRTYMSGLFLFTYSGGYTTLPEGLKTDIKKVAAWLFQNRGVQFDAEEELKKTTTWASLNAHAYSRNVI